MDGFIVIKNLCGRVWDDVSEANFLIPAPFPLPPLKKDDFNLVKKIVLA